MKTYTLRFTGRISGAIAVRQGETLGDAIKALYCPFWDDPGYEHINNILVLNCEQH